MTIRTQAVTQLITHLEQQLGCKGHRGLQLLHEINDFPQFYIHPGQERRVHIGRNERFGLIEADIRGYTYADDIEHFARSLETGIQSWSAPYIDEARVVSLSTDEGLLKPYEVCDISAQILYRIEL